MHRHLAPNPIHYPSIARTHTAKPWLAVLTLLGIAAAEASPEGQAALNNKLTPAANPALRVAVTVQTAVASDLLLALYLALNDPANSGLTVADLSSSALEANPATGRVRADRNKIAGQVLATAVSTRDLTDDPANFTATVDAIFRVNSTSSLARNRLTIVGQANTLATALKIATPALATSLAQTFATTTFTGTETDLNTLLTNSVKVIGTSTPVAQPEVSAFVAGLFQQNKVPAADRKTFSLNIAEKLAATNPAGAGAVLGGYAQTELTDDTARLNFALQDVLPDRKLPKAIGEILGTTMTSYADKTALETQLISGRPAATQAIITQGVLRAGTAADATNILNVILPSIVAQKRASFTTTVLTRNGEDPAKAKAIVTEIGSGQGVTGKTAIGVAALNAVGTLNPETGEAITQAIIDSDTGTDFNSNSARLTLGQNFVLKAKSFAEAGYVAEVIVDRNLVGSASPTADAAVIAGTLMLKKVPAATDIAERTATVSALPDPVAYADAISDFNKRLVKSAAIGVSIADPTAAAAITVAAITHNPTTDKTALAQAASISGAVALAVDEEQAAEIAAQIATHMSLNGLVAGQPIKLSLATALTTAIGKAVQTRPGVTTLNRQDELGEVAASITGNILGKYGLDSRGLTAEAKAVTAVGTALLRVLSTKELVESKDLAADRTEAQDIVGSIAETIRVTDPSRQAALLGTLNGTTLIPGSLSTALLRIMGAAPTAKRPNPHYTEVQQAIIRVLQGLGVGHYEIGPVIDKESDTVNF